MYTGALKQMYPLYILCPLLLLCQFNADLCFLQESVEFLNYVVKKLKFSHLESRIPVEFQVVELPSAHHLCKVKALNKEDANSQVTVYYQSGARNLREYTMMELLVLHMEEPSFDFLRTKQTLG
eukprot:XP_004920861.2 PREDICTED: nardilysin-like [Xenopus tropicalis]